MKVFEILEEDPKMPAIRDLNTGTIKRLRQRNLDDEKAKPNLKRRGQEAGRRRRSYGIGHPEGED